VQFYSSGRVATLLFQTACGDIDHFGDKISDSFVSFRLYLKHDCLSLKALLTGSLLEIDGAWENSL